MNTLFLFAHQDDEYGIYAKINEHCLCGDAVHCVYLTDGGPQAQRRCQESQDVLGSLGVAPSRVLFPGYDHAWRDGLLHESYADCCRWLANLLAELAPVGDVYAPAWEGGHQDHDTVHAVAAATIHHKGAHSRLWQFPLYNGHRTRWPLFRTMVPLTDNGPVLRTPIQPALRLRYTRLCLSYSSQRTTWLGLFFPVALQYIVAGAQQLQSVPHLRLERPHKGKLLYEQRGFCSWDAVRTALQEDPFEVHHG
ncbi:MAG: PIG-L family deacetylase [Desulfovibrio sp.]|nr:PIG-L family deacetylase [Desulfovibrio sp.]